MAYVRKDEEEDDGNPPLSVLDEEQEAEVMASERDLEVGEEVVRLEHVVGAVLQWGSLLSMAIVVLGLIGVVWYTRTARGPAILLIPVIGTHDLNTPAGLLARIRNGDPTAVISLGLLVLILTPVLRVASTVVYFFIRKDRTYLVVTGFVLLVLIAGFLLGTTAG